MTWWELVLSGLVDQLDKAIKAGADLAKISDDKNYMTALWLIKRYKPELDELADKSETSIDDKVVEELYQVACAAWPE
jgi:hypothetical protein